MSIEFTKFIDFFWGGVFMELYQRLKDLREDHDLTQQDIAEILQTTREQVSKYETGKQMMGVDKYIKLARFYNVSLDYLTGIIDTPRKLF
jgi:transcriptional regulator with XRE-family HTH domain